MCFSATASIVAGTALSVAGVATTVRARKRKAALPFAMLPLLFGIQQLAEGLVWLSFGSQVSSFNAVATYLFSLFAFIIWPIFVPFAVVLLETVPWRRKMLYICQVLGLAVGLYLLYMHTAIPVTSHIAENHIIYTSTHFYGLLVLVLYFISTIGSCLLSSQRILQVFGAITFFSAAAAHWFYTEAFVSVWCFFAAALSIIVCSYFFGSRFKNQPFR